MSRARSWRPPIVVRFVCNRIDCLLASFRRRRVVGGGTFPGRRVANEVFARVRLGSFRAGTLEEELRPATPLQRLAFNQIASLTWRLERLPEAQVRIFEQLAKVEPDERDERRDDGTVQLKPSDVLARRFSDDPASNGFALLERYERGLRSQLLR